MGWLYHQHKNTKLNLNRLLVFGFWLISLLVFLITIFMCYWRNTPTIIVSSIMSFGKLIFGILIGGIIFICQHGYGGAFNKLMGSSAFLFLNKFCFSIYMLAPVLISAVFGLRTEGTLFSELASTMDVIGVVGLSILSSILCVIFIEIPFMKFSNRFILPRYK